MVKGRPPSRFPVRDLRVGDTRLFRSAMPLRDFQMRVGSAIGQLKRRYGYEAKFTTEQVPSMNAVAVRRIA